MGRCHLLATDRMPDGMQASCSTRCNISSHCPWARRVEVRRFSRSKSASERQSDLEVSLKAQEPPWAFGFQLNERYLKLDKAGHFQLLKMLSAEKLGKDHVWVEKKLEALQALLPDLVSKLGSMKIDTFTQLVANTEVLAERMAHLRELFPCTNVSALVSKLPALVLEYDSKEISRRFTFLSDTFSDRTDVEFLVAREPALLLIAASPADVTELLDNVKRLLPVGDPINFFISNPGLVMDMEASRLPSAIDRDLTES